MKTACLLGGDGIVILQENLSVGSMWWYVIGWGKNLRMLHLHAWEKQGPRKEPYKVTQKGKEVQPRMFQWSDKQQPVLQVSEMLEILSVATCTMASSPPGKAYLLESVGAQAKHRSSQPPSALRRRKSRVSDML